jgi:hypothetical protein
VRELYALDEHRLLMVATDNISAFDHVLTSPIPDKGAILTQLSLWWFDQLADVVDNHVLSADVPPAVAGRAVICERLAMVPFECVARGYLTGSGWLEYQQSRTVCGVGLPGGLVDGSRLPEPIFTPATKAALGEHDVNVSFEVVAEIIGAELATVLRDLTLAGDHPGRHQGRVRPAARRFGRAGRRGADPGLVEVLGRGQLVAGRASGLLRQAVRPRLAAARVGLGPARPGAAAAAAPGGGGRHPGEVRRGVPAADRAGVLGVTLPLAGTAGRWSTRPGAGST